MPTDFDVNQYNEIARAHDLRGHERAYSMFHDETNNHGKLTLREDGSLNVQAVDNFLLGGIVLAPGSSVPDIAPLRALLRVQKNAPELKFKHVATGSFEEVLTSKRLGMFLRWIIEHEIAIHYTNLNVLYWSLVDIIDSLIVVEPLTRYMASAMEMKNELYRIAQSDPPVFKKLLASFGYPRIVAHDSRGFLEALSSFVEHHCPRSFHASTTYVRELFRAAVKVDSFVFLEGEERGQLIKSFHDFFLHPLYVFKNADHVFDREPVIQRALAEYRVIDGPRIIRHRFADSKAKAGIQLSDVVVGLLGKFFNYAENASIRCILSLKANLNPVQRENLDLLRDISSASLAWSNAFLHDVTAMDSREKAATLLDDRPAPWHPLRIEQD